MQINLDRQLQALAATFLLPYNPRPAATATHTQRENSMLMVAWTEESVSSSEFQDRH